jgi:hypothetical protein
MYVGLDRIINAARMVWTVHVASMETQEVHYFNRHEGPLTSSQEHVTGPHPKSPESSHPHSIPVRSIFNIIFAIMPQVLRVVPFFSGLSG